MKIQRIISIFAAVLLFINVASAQYQGWQYLNHESGGYVTEIIPVKYTGQLPSSVNNQVLYARTDVGGIYRSSDNGTSWKIINNYFRKDAGYSGLAISDLSIQGLAVKDNGDGTETVLIATGFYTDDMNPTSCIFKSVNSGQSWVPVSQISIQSPGILFRGNDFPVKIGGPCIVFDPNYSGIMYAGGRNPSLDLTGVPYLYKSTDNGQSWLNNDPALTNFHSVALDGECIISIAIKPGNTQNIWVGTSKGVVYTTNAGATWNRIALGTPIDPYVKKVILKSDANNNIIGAMFTWGNQETVNDEVITTTGLGRATATNNWAFEDLTTNFNASSPSGFFSALAFTDETENTVISGLYERPIKTTGDFGNTWSTDIPFSYTTGYNSGDPDYNNIPKHSDETTEMYDGMSYFTRNPNNWGTGSTVWYMSGGAGGKKTAPSYGVTGSDFANAKWQYTVNGQTMPVMYDVVFHNLKFNGVDKSAIYLPMSDWTMSWEYQQNFNFTGTSGMISTPLKYDRQLTQMCNWDTYISNVTRILFNPDDPNLAYCVGGSVYPLDIQNCATELYRAGFYKRRDNDGSGNNFTIERVANGPFLNIDDRAIVDAIIFKTPGNANRIIALVGLYSDQTPPNGTTIGVFHSDNGGDSWTPGAFDQPCLTNGISTQTKYSQSKIRGIYSQGAIDGTVGALFDGNFSLCYAENGIVYLWLESRVDGNNTVGGGLFKSVNNGDSWAYVASQPHAGYYGPGSLKYLGNNQIGLAVEGFDNTQHGLYRGTINTSTGEISHWEVLGGFESAKHLDFQSGAWAVWGKRTGDTYNELYKSLDNGSTWTRIPENANDLPLFGQIHSLRIRPAPYNNELWISTSGQGTFIYKNFQTVCLQPITNHYTINNDAFTNDCDVIVENGGIFEVNNCPSFTLAPNKSVIVHPGGKVIFNNVTFDCTTSGSQWGGIYINNTADGSSIIGCTFNNAMYAVTVANDQWSTMLYDMKIADNHFNVPDNSTGIYGTNVFALDINNNIFQLLGSMSFGITIQNSLPAPPVMWPWMLKNRISNNTFTGGVVQMDLEGLAGELVGFLIQKNVCNNTGGVCMLGRSINGTIENNTFQSTSNEKTVMLVQSSPNVLNNTMVNSSAGASLSNDGSYPVMCPTVSDDGNYIWYGGMNDLQSGSGNDIACTMGYPLIDFGRNKFTYSASQYHISGQVDDALGNDYYGRDNCWYGNNGNASVYVWNNNVNPLTFHSELINYSCGAPIAIDGFFVTQELPNVFDTIYTSANTSGIQTGQDEILFSEAMRQGKNGDYSSAIAKYKDIIENYSGGKFLLGSLYALYSMYEYSDTSSHNVRVALFTDLKNYISSKVMSYQNNVSFCDAGYNFILMCEVKTGELIQAAAGYEFLSLNHPQPERRLLASMDYETVQSMMGTGGSLIENSEDIWNRIVMDVELLIKRDTLTNIASKTFASIKEKRDKGNNTFNSKADNQKEKLFDSKVSYNMRNSKSMNREQKVKNHMDNIKMLAGVYNNKDKKQTNSVPLTFSLSQNYPNPFNPSTKIAYELPMDAKVKLVIYDILGREVKTLLNNELKSAGKYIVEFNGSSLSSGLYFYRIEVQGAKTFSAVKKMVLIK